MKPPLAFISFDITRHEPERARFVSEIESSSLPFDVEDWSSPRQVPSVDWDKMVRAKIGRCDILIVLVADDMDRASVAGEILEAKRYNVPFFGVYVGDAGPQTALPEGLARNRVVPWDWNRIAAAVTQVSKEGKNYTFT